MTRGAAPAMLAVLALAPAVYAGAQGAARTGIAWIASHADAAAQVTVHAPSGVTAPLVACGGAGAAIAYATKR